MIIYFAILAVSVALGYFVGQKRYIGIGWTVFFCITGSILLSLPIIFSSSKKNGPPRKFSSVQNVFGWITIVLGLVALIGLLMAGANSGLGNMPDKGYDAIGNAFSIAIFLVGLGAYLLQSNSFNKKFYCGNTPQHSAVQQPQAPLFIPPNPPVYNGGHNANSRNTYSPTTAPTEIPPQNKSEHKSKEFDSSKLYGKN